MREIKFSGGTAIVDDEDYDALSEGFRWWLHKDASHPIGYAQGKHRKNKKIFYMHRLVAERMGEDIGGMLVDHRDMNTLDNRRSNLRIATRSQSQWNKRTYRNNKSGFKGVCWAADRSKWVVQLQKNRKSFFRGEFNHLPDAAQASMFLIYVAHEDFARLK